MPSIRNLYLILDLPMQHHQLHEFRTQFKELRSMAYNRDEEGKNVFGFPLIQFRVHMGHAAVFAINDGAAAIEKLVKKKGWRVLSREVNHDFPLAKLAGKKMMFYRMYRWIPMDERYFPSPAINQLLDDNDAMPVIPWNQQFMDEKVKTLEGILVTNIIEFAQKAEWRISKNKSLRVRLQDIHHINTVKLYGRDVLAFDITYAANIALPDHLGLGRGKSLGYGWQRLSEHNEKLNQMIASAPAHTVRQQVKHSVKV